MPKVSQTQKLGLNLGPRESYLLNIDCSPNRLTVNHLVDIDLGAPFDFETISDKDALLTIGESLKSNLHSENISTEEIYISLNHSMAMVRNLPIDDSMKDAELREHVLWEIEQHVISPMQEYSFDFQKIPQSFSSRYPTILLVTVKKQIIDAVKIVADAAGLNINLIDINVFSVINALEKNYLIKPKEMIVIIGISQQYLLFTILKGTSFLGFHPIPLKSSNNLSIEVIYNEITKNLRFFISDYKADDSKKEFDKVFIYKLDKSVDLKDLIDIKGDLSFEVLNPLKKLLISPKLRERMDPLSDYSEFTTSVGLVVRD